MFWFCISTLNIISLLGADEVIYRRVGERAVLNSPGLPQQFYVSWFFERGPEIEIADVSYFGRKHVNPGKQSIGNGNLLSFWSLPITTILIIIVICGTFDIVLYSINFASVSGEIWTSRLSISTNSLIINNMQEENFGTIVCKVKDGTNLYTTVKFHLIKVMGKKKLWMFCILTTRHLTLTWQNIWTMFSMSCSELKYLPTTFSLSDQFFIAF